MGNVDDGYGQQVVPAPHAAHGHAVQTGTVNVSHTPATQTWFVWQTLPQLPQFCGADWSAAAP